MHKTDPKKPPHSAVRTSIDQCADALVRAQLKRQDELLALRRARAHQAGRHAHAK